jgi:thiamine-monophosphate kinase
VPGVRVGPGDDAAVVSGDGIVLSSDMSVEDVHFRRAWLTPRQIGRRAAVAALSDLAAMAARPIGVLASLAISRADAAAMATEILAGVSAAVAEVGGALLGGDLTRSAGGIVIDVVVVGEARRPVLRSGGRVGDEVWVTGELGGAALAVRTLLSGETPIPSAMQRFAAPVARVREALWLADREIPTAMLDLSDGIAGDLSHLARSSDVAVVLDTDRLPVHPALSRGISPEEALQLALTGGEDYELCFTAPPGVVEQQLADFGSRFGIRLTRVGMVEAGGEVFLRNAQGGRRAVAEGGFQHFAD